MYRKRGSVIASIHNGTLEKGYRLKQENQLTDKDGILICDEIEQQMIL
ncbi:MAG: hypothetical protein WCE68_15660 [Anaerolineales bacterium]